MPKASELKKGMVVEINGIPHAVKQLEANRPLPQSISTPVLGGGAMAGAGAAIKEKSNA